MHLVYIPPGVNFIKIIRTNISYEHRFTSYVLALLKNLMKLTTGVNFINILYTHFLYESKLSSFSLITFGFMIFGAKILYEKHWWNWRQVSISIFVHLITVWDCNFLKIGAKSARRMLVKWLHVLCFLRKNVG